MPVTFTETSDGVVLIANGIDPVKRWDGYEPTVTPAGCEAPPPAAQPVIAGAGGGAITGTYSCFVRFVDRFGNRSNPTLLAEAVTVSGVGGFLYSSLPVPTEGTVARRQILRNTAGQFSVFYVDVDTTDVASTQLATTRPDASLVNQEDQPMRGSDGTTLFDRYGRPPGHLSIMAFHLGRVFGTGIADYSEGSVAVAAGSATATFTGAALKEQFAGRRLHVVGADRAYAIDRVDPAGGTATLAEPYRGSTDPFAAYAIRPDPGEANLVYFSEAGAPDAWPADNALAIREDGDRITALIPCRSFLFVAKRRQLYRISAESNPADDGFVFDSAGRGCVNPRTWVKVDEVVYVMDEQGVYRFDGGQAEPLSTPVQDLFRGRTRGRFRINWGCSRYFHAAYSPAEEVVRFFVTMNGGYLPRYALCYATSLQRWWVEEYPVPVGASCLGRIGRTTNTYTQPPDQPYLGGPAGKVFALGPGTVDVAQAWQPEFAGAVQAAGSVTVTPAAAVPAAASGCPIAIVAGRGRGQVRRVVRVRGDGDVEVDRPWLVRPDATSEYAVGVVPYSVKTHRLEFTAREEQDGFSVQVGFEPQRWGAATARLWIDHAAAPQPVAVDLPGEDDGLSARKGDDGVTVDMTFRRGFVHVRGDRHGDVFTPQARTVAIELRGASGPTPHTFTTMVVNGVIHV